MRPVLQNTAIKNCFRFSSSVVCWSFCVQFNHLLRDILGLGPPLGPFPLACVSIVPYQKVRAASLFDACAVIAPHSLQVVLMSFSTPPHSQHHYNSAAFKARTKQRSKFRDKRADIM